MYHFRTWNWTVRVTSPPRNSCVSDTELFYLCVYLFSYSWNDRIVSHTVYQRKVEETENYWLNIICFGRRICLIEVLARHLRGWAEEIHKTQSRYLISQPRFELGVSSIQVKNFYSLNHLAWLLHRAESPADHLALSRRRRLFYWLTRNHNNKTQQSNVKY